MEYQKRQDYQQLSEREQAQINRDVKMLIELRKRSSEFQKQLEGYLDDRYLSGLYCSILEDVNREENK